MRSHLHPFLCLIQIVKWFSLKNGMVALGLATSHHDSKIASTFAQQLGWVFVGPCHPSAHGPPATNKVQALHLLGCFTHTNTYTPRSSRALKAPTNEMKVKMKRKWRWDDDESEMTKYLTGTQDGERKRTKEKRENTNTNTPSPERANPERAREEKKSGRTTGQTPTRGGGRTEAPDATYKARAKPTTAREGPKPDLT